MRIGPPAIPRICVSVNGLALIDVGAVGKIELGLIQVAGQAQVGVGAGQIQVDGEIHKWSIGHAAVCVDITTPKASDRIEHDRFVERRSLCILQLIPVGLRAVVATLSLEVDLMNSHCRHLVLVNAIVAVLSATYCKVGAREEKIQCCG